ncbi:MAG TPA: hypothetical protein VFS56_09620, partial [Gemmatimonadaceae bacterium]|nr:hypothetical protein [Gemmatimonadaceae bacterium]
MIVGPSALVPTCRAGALLAAVFVAVSPLAGQSNDSRPATPRTEASKVSKSARWSADVESKAGLQYDHNVFLLSSAQRAALGSPSSEVSASGRYESMESANDMLAIGNIGLEVKGPGVGGRTLEISPSLSYEFASRNELRREAAAALSIAQSLGGGRRVRFRAEAAPNHFSRNYLEDAFDADADGSISPAERIYTKGEYADYSVGGDLRLPLGRTRKTSLAVATAGLGYYARSYNTPFAVRDLAGPTAALSLDVAPRAPLGLELTYELAALSANAGRQVVLLDEAVYNVDFNGNGTATDLEARAVVDVDRSRLEHQLGGAVTFGAGKKLAATLGYDYRLRSFRSELPYDENGAGRRDRRNGVRGSIRSRVSRSLTISAGARFRSQTTNR